MPEWEKSSRASDLVWKSIREKEVDTSRPLTLAELVNIALRNNPSTKKAWLDAQAAEAGEKQAQSKWYPQVDVNGQFIKEKKVAHPETDNMNMRKYDMGAKASLLVLDLGGRHAAVREAYQQMLAANFDFNQAIQDLLLQTEKSYYSFYSAKAQVIASEADVKDAEKTMEAANQKFRVGLASKLDSLQAESDYDDALYQLEDAKGQAQAAKADMAEVLGLSADTGFQIADPPKEIPTDISREDISALIEKALSQRPDIAASRARLRAKEEAVKVANSDLWPTLNIGGSADKGWYEYFGPDEATKSDYEYTGYLSVNWDVFDGFNNLSKRNEARAEARAEREVLRQAELAASGEVWTRYYDFRTAIQKLTYSKAFLKTSETSYELAMDGYKSGLKSILDLLQAQSNLSEARSRLVQSEKDLFVALVELVHSTGSLYVKESLSE